MKYPCRRKAAGTSSDESIFAIKRSSLPVTDSMSVLVNTTKSEELSTRSCTSFSQAASNGMTIGITSSSSGNNDNLVYCAARFNRVNLKASIQLTDEFCVRVGKHEPNATPAGVSKKGCEFLLLTHSKIFFCVGSEARGLRNRMVRRVNINKVAMPWFIQRVTEILRC